MPSLPLLTLYLHHKDKSELAYCQMRPHEKEMSRHPSSGHAKPVSPSQSTSRLQMHECTSLRSKQLQTSRSTQFTYTHLRKINAYYFKPKKKSSNELTIERITVYVICSYNIFKNYTLKTRKLARHSRESENIK